MLILPVIDLKAGQVVRAVAGNRESYRPVVSKLATDPSPAAVASAFAQKLAAREVYVADLDAIGGAEPDWQSLARIAAAGVRLWLDCGIADVRRARAVAEYSRREKSLTGIIVGLESTPGPEALRELLFAVGTELAIFSLDLRNGAPLTSSPAWQGFSPLDIAQAAIETGFTRLVVLDLARVGVGEGPGVVPLCRELRKAHAHLRLAAGGGVRGPEDLALLAAAGCDYALVASALHDGRLTPEDLINFSHRSGQVGRPSQAV